MTVLTEVEADVVPVAPVAIRAVKNVVLATRLSAIDAAFVLEAVQERSTQAGRNITVAEFLAEAALAYAQDEGLWGDKPDPTGLSADDTCATR